MKRRKEKVVLRLLILFLILLLNLLLGARPVKAAEEDSLHIDELDFDEVDRIVTESGAQTMLEEQTQSRTVGELLEAVVSGSTSASWQDWVAAFGNSLWGNMKSYVGLMLKVIGLVMISRCFSSLSDHF